MQQSCKTCGTAFQIEEDHLQFLEQVSPIFKEKKESLPAPTNCPDCRQQRRLALCNERFFYQGKCGLCGKSSLTELPPHLNKTIYCRDCWHGDGWDACAYGRDVDFTRPIFEQIKELWSAVPSQNLNVEGTNINSDYIHYAGFAKNCYLIMHADFCEDCYYGYGFKKNTSCADGFYNLQCELCYDCVDINRCYGLIGCQDCINCSSSAFLRDCIGCKNCFLCVGLREKEYCFENQQLTKEDYAAKMREIDLGSHHQYQQYKAKRKEVERPHPFKAFQGHNNELSSGDHLVNCKDVRDSFDCEDVEGGRYLYQVVTGAKNDRDIYQYGLGLQESYECSIAGNSYHILLSHNAHTTSSNLLYCWFTECVKDSFGCVNMHNKQYCILNKQYTKEQYEELVPKIIAHMRETGEWGELFPVTSSVFGYNKTNAQLYYPMTKEEVEAKGWKWDDYEPPAPTVAKTISADQLPDNIKEVPDEILQWAIVCEKTGKPFKVQTLELKMLRQMNVPIPRRSPDQRHLDRFALRNPRKIWSRNCEKCGDGMETTYAPDRTETVYCEKCYLESVY